MSGTHSAFDLGTLDRLSRGTSSIHRLDPRAKLAVTLAFVMAVVSLDKYAVGDLLPFFLFPAILLARSAIPLRVVIRKVAVVAPFAVLVGVFNPLIDTEIMLRIGNIGISGGWLSFASIVLRFALTIGALVLLVATTGVPALGRAAERLGTPKIFVMQVLGLYRYLFLLVDEAQRTTRAYRLRSVHGKAPAWRVFAQLLGQLLLRAMARARRVYEAMLCRGFDGELRLIGKLQFTFRDWIFMIAWIAVFAGLRFLHPADVIGHLVMGGRA
jgi:cobalt/nickel transport system permease protein